MKLIAITLATFISIYAAHQVLPAFDVDIRNIYWLAGKKGASCENSVDWKEALTASGRYVSITGPLLQASATRERGEGIAWLEIGETRGNNRSVIVVLEEDSRKEFPSIESDMSMDGRPVCASGLVRNINGSARLNIIEAGNFKAMPFVVTQDLISELLNVAQDLENNHRWLISLAVAQQNQAIVMPPGELKTQRLVQLLAYNYGFLTQNAYGEEKHLFGLARKFDKVTPEISQVATQSNLKDLQKKTGHTLHDLIFINDFLRWYLSPHILEHVPKGHLEAIGWDSSLQILPSDFTIDGVRSLNFHLYTDNNNKPFTDYRDFLALID